MTGGSGFWGEGMRMGSELAAEEINAAGGIDGVPIRIIYEDSQFQPRPGLEGATKLIEVDKVPAIMLSGSSVIPAVKPLAEDKHIVLLNTSALLFEQDYRGNKYFFSIQVSREQVTRDMMDVAEELGFDKMVIDYGNNAMGQGMAKIVAEEWPKRGHTVLANQSHELDQKDFRTELLKFKALKPDGIFLIPYAWQEGALIVQQMAELGWTVPRISLVTMFSEELIKQAAAAAEGTIVSMSGFNFFDVANPKLVTVTEKFQKRYGKDIKTYSDFAAQSYDSVYLLAWAIKKGGYTADGIAGALRGLKGFDGVIGRNLSIDPELGTIQMKLGRAWVHNGKWEQWPGVRR